MAAASHRRVDGDPATLVAYDRNCARDGARDDARRKYDGVGLDRVVIEPHAPGLDRPDSGRDLDVNPAPLEHARGRGDQLRVNLWQNPRAGLEQPKANLVAPEARIEAQHVVGKRRELTPPVPRRPVRRRSRQPSNTRAASPHPRLGRGRAGRPLARLRCFAAEQQEVTWCRLRFGVKAARRSGSRKPSLYWCFMPVH